MPPASLLATSLTHPQGGESGCWVRNPVLGLIFLPLPRVGGLVGRNRVPSAQALLAKLRCWDIEGTRVNRDVVLISSCLSHPLSIHTPLGREGGGVGDTEGRSGWTVGARRGGGTHSLRSRLEGSGSWGCCPRTLQRGITGRRFSARYPEGFLQFISSIDGKSCPESSDPLVIGSALPRGMSTKY